VGKGEEMRLSDSLMNSEMSSDQQGVLIERGDQRSVMIIGGIQIFLPSRPVEVTMHVADSCNRRRTTNNDCHRGRRNGECQNLPQQKKRHAVKMFTPWEKELEMLEDWLKIQNQ
jgi:hypothetical protein